jgi:hypothetical protein
MSAAVMLVAALIAAHADATEPPGASRAAMQRESVDAKSRGADRPPRHAPADIDWQTSPLDLDLRGMNGERYAFHCPPGKPVPARVVGSGPYADNASICAAAVHAGALGAKDGGDVAIEIRPGESHYAGSESHYIRSTPYDRAWGGSFVVLRNGTASTP